MTNFLLVVVEVFICYISIILLFKKYNIDGLYIYGIITTFILCILSLKKIDIFSINIPLGFVISTSLVIAGNLITQKKGPRELKTFLILIATTIILSSIYLNISSYITSSQFNEFANKSYDNIFIYNLKVSFGLLISIVISIWINSQIYYRLKTSQNNIIISNIFSITIVMLLENIIFILIGYLFEYSLIEFILCIVFRYIIKLIIGILGTIPLYIANKYN